MIMLMSVMYIKTDDPVVCMKHVKICVNMMCIMLI